MWFIKSPPTTCQIRRMVMRGLVHLRMGYVHIINASTDSRITTRLIWHVVGGDLINNIFKNTYK